MDSPSNVNVSLMAPSNKNARAFITEDAIILKSQRHFKTETSCGFNFSCIPSGSSTTQTNETVIPFSNIIWADKQADAEDAEDIDLDFIVRSHGNLALQNLKIHIEDFPPNVQVPLHTNIIEKAYPGVRLFEKKILVLINPHGGQGNAVQYFNKHCKPILDKAHCTYEFLQTEFYQHAIKIAREMDLDKYDCILCASGDGIPHEVINGLYQREDRVDAFNKLIVAQLPCGSGNAMSLSCLGSSSPAEATVALLKSTVVRTDVMALTQGTGELASTKLSFLSQTYGIIAEADIGTEWLRFMGPARFDAGVLINILARSKYPCDIYIKYLAKDKPLVASHFDSHYGKLKTPPLTEESFLPKYPGLDESVPSDWEKFDEKISEHLGIFYAGKMPYMAKDVNFFPAALPNDGSIDLVITDTRTKILSTAESLLSIDKGTHVLSKDVQHSKILAYRLSPRMEKSYISVDGESFPFEPFQVEIIPGALQVLLKNGVFTETGFNR